MQQLSVHHDQVKHHAKRRNPAADGQPRTTCGGHVLPPLVSIHQMCKIKMQFPCRDKDLAILRKGNVCSGSRGSFGPGFSACLPRRSRGPRTTVTASSRGCFTTASTSSTTAFSSRGHWTPRKHIRSS